MITGNNSKFSEFSVYFPGLTMLNCDLPEIQELDIVKVIEAKLSTARQFARTDAIFVEDTSLHLACLNGYPGPLIKWTLQAIGLEGLHRICALHGNTAATATCTLGLSDPASTNPVYFSASLHGTIVPPAGKAGFGWDAIFQPDGETKTLAELKESAGTVTMRSKVATQARSWISGQTRDRKDESCA